ncbi:MAG TPA: AAA family ATPase, partial [Candidatus Thermoplasmatota archaeon]|nr:AAA family ATPase [Candidatus Thermoplasmatota archaeon]
MRIHSLELENYRRFARAALEFPDGVLGLLGRNGAGKSTLVEAIGWALFGHDAARTPKEHLKLRGAQGDCRVRLCFELGGEEYEVVRELVGKAQQHNAVLKVGGRVLVAPGPNSAREVTSALERALRMDREAFFASLVARQGELSALVDLTPARRKDVVLRMLRIDAVDGAIALAREARRRAQAQLDALAGQRLDPAALGARAATLAAQRQQELSAADAAARALAATDESLAAVGKAKAAADERRRAFEALGARIASHRAQAAAAERAAEHDRAQLVALDEVEADVAKLRPEAEEHARLRVALEALDGLREAHLHRQRLAGEVRQLEADVEEATRSLEAAQGGLAEEGDLRAQAEMARAERVAGEQACAERRAQLASVEATLRDVRLALSQAAARRGEVERLGTAAACPLCEQSLAEALPKLLARLDADLAGERARLEALQRKRDHAARLLSAGLEVLDAAASRAEGLRRRAEQMARRESEVEVRRAALGELDARLHARRDALTALGPSLFDDAAYAEQKALAARLAPALERLLGLQARLAARPALQEELARHDAEGAGARADLLAAERERADVAFDPAALRTLEERLHDLQDRARAQAVDVERRRGAVERLDAEIVVLEQEQA